MYIPVIIKTNCMNLKVKLYAIAIVLFFVAACKNKSESNQDSKAIAINESRADSAAFEPPAVSEKDYMNSTTSRMGLKDSNRRFVVSADLKFRVKEVVSATYAIEGMVMQTGGYIMYTELRSEREGTEIIPVSPDSSLETIYYTVVNDLNVRVPKTELDTFLRSVGKLVDYFDYRIIKADDVGLSLLSNSLQQKRLNEYNTRQKNAIDNRGKKLEETSNAEDNLLDKQQLADAAMINNLQLNDNIRYSTVSIKIYQRQGVKRTVVANDANIKRYEPSFGTKMWQALTFGWEAFVYFVLFLSRLWVLILLIVAGIFLYKWFKKRKV